MSFNAGTYTPGDAWSSTEFYGRALTTPRLVVPHADAGDGTPASFFEYRQGVSKNDPFVEVSVFPNSVDEAGEEVTPAASFSVVLERSFDNGVTWHVADTFTEATEQRVEMSGLFMLRLRVVSGDNISIALRQF